MRPVLLFITAFVLPLVWGWGVNLLLGWLWPVSATSSAHRRAEHRLDPLTDYQI